MMTSEQCTASHTCWCGCRRQRTESDDTEGPYIGCRLCSDVAGVAFCSGQHLGRGIVQAKQYRRVFACTRQCALLHCRVTLRDRTMHAHDISYRTYAAQAPVARRLTQLLLHANKRDAHHVALRSRSRSATSTCSLAATERSPGFMWLPLV